MVSYIAIYGAAAGVEHTTVEAVVTDQDGKMQVFGDSNVADDLRDAITDIGRGGTGEERLTQLIHGYRYHRIHGPITAVDKRTPELVAMSYGL